MSRYTLVSVFLLFISCHKTVNESDITVNHIYPDSDGQGATIEIIGRGFGNKAAAAVVSFNGVRGTIDSCSDSVLYVVIPAGATTGPITIASPGHHTYKTPDNFIILSGKWVKKAGFPGPPRSGAASFTINNIAYVVAGVGKDYTEFTDMYAYDPVADSWTKKASLPGPGRAYPFILTIGNEAYLIGGWDSVGYSLHFLSDVWEYDPSANSWTRNNDFPGRPRIYAAGFTVGNIGYYGLGDTHFGSDTMDWWRYDPTADSWTRKADFFYDLYSANYGYTINGTGFLLTFGNYQNWYAYDTATDQWTPGNHLPAWVDAHGLSFTVGNQAYFIAGTGLSPETWIFDPAAATWARQTSPTIYRIDGICFGVNDHFYVGLGQQYYPPSADWPTDFWELQP